MEDAMGSFSGGGGMGEPEGSGGGGEDGGTSMGSAGLLPWERKVMEEVLGQYRQGWFLMKREREGGVEGAKGADGEGEEGEEGEKGEKGELEEEEIVEWVRPRLRAILPLDGEFYVSKSLRRRITSGRFLVTSDLGFGEVIRACAAATRERPETWLHEEIVFVFELLHRAGHAHSVEVWREMEGKRLLVGGLYGLALGGLFCGESMFSRPELGGTDASKVALVYLVERLRSLRFEMLDTQLWNPHMAQFGCAEMPDEVYTRAIEGLVGQVRREWKRGEMRLRGETGGVG